MNYLTRLTRQSIRRTVLTRHQVHPSFNANQTIENIPSRTKHASLAEDRRTSCQVSNRIDPWFVEEEEEEKYHQEPVGHDTKTNQIKSKTYNLPKHLNELHRYLVDSPFFDPTSLTFIDAKLEQGDTAWTDWVVLVTLKPGRESSFRGAAEAVKSILEKKIDFVRIEGIHSTTTHSFDSLSCWILVDAGNVVVHILNEKSRLVYDLEQVWKNPQFPLS